MTVPPLRHRLRERLIMAMRERDRAAASGLRTVLAALDNAEAVPVDELPGPGGQETGPVSGGPVAGAVTGLGAGEVSRRFLDEEQQRRIVDAEIAEMRVAALARDAAGDAGRAADLRRAIEVVSGAIGG